MRVWGRGYGGGRELSFKEEVSINEERNKVEKSVMSLVCVLLAIAPVTFVISDALMSVRHSLAASKTSSSASIPAFSQ